MMRRTLLFPALILCFALLATPALAQPTQPPTEPSGEACEWQRFKEALGARESSGNYQAVNRLGYLGKYQFGSMALIDIGYKTRDGNWTGKNGINSQEDFLNSPQVQESAMEEWAVILNRDVELAGLERFIGQQIGDDCVVTRSGMLAGRHLLGIGNSNRPGLRAYLESNGAIDPMDGNPGDSHRTPISEYVCRFSNYQTPFDGTVAGQCGQNGPPPPPTGEPGPGRSPDSDIDGDGGYQPRARWDDLRSGLLNLWVGSLMLMAEQLSVTMISQVQSIGMMLDAKHQQETQRIMQERTAQAHKDYQPSEQMCTIGTLTRDLSTAERSAALTKEALVAVMVQSDTQLAPVARRLTQIHTYMESFCSSADNGGGLGALCPQDAPAEMRNADINYTRTVDMPLTLELNFADNVVTDDEVRVSALLDNLISHDSMPHADTTTMAKPSWQYQYFKMRSIMALRSLARNSIATVISFKSANLNTDDSIAPYARAVLAELGLSNAEITEYLGENPSYGAYMDLITRKLMEIDLNDTPVNVVRIDAAVTALKNRQQRYINKAQERRAVLLGALAEVGLRKEDEKAVSNAEKALFY